MTEAAMLDLIGRTLMIGFDGLEMTSQLAVLLTEIRPGGIILFKRNADGGPGQIARLVRDCQDLAEAELGRNLLVAIDQEGGPVRRLGPPFTELPSQRFMARSMTVEQVRELGAVSGRELAAVGINFNLAPVLDLQTDPEAVFMAERSFGPDPSLAAAMGTAIMTGHARHGVLTCVKHFPGIGDTRLDPHHELSTVGHPASRLRDLEMAPFREVIAKGVPAVMTSHINFPGLDPVHPATFSRRIQEEILRGELGFQGLLLSDDLEMGAIVKNYRMGPAAVGAFLAGADLLLICRLAEHIREAQKAMMAAVRSGEIPTARLEETSSRLEAALAMTSRPDFRHWREVFPGHEGE